METMSCGGCGRVNSRAAKKCIWCGLPVISDEITGNFEVSQIDLDYVSGLVRLDEPVPVRLLVGPTGVEVIEIMPGSRRVLIPAGSLVESRIEPAAPGADPKAFPRQRLVIGKLNITIPGGRARAGATRMYNLIIDYREGSETRSAVFHREESRGTSSIKNIARIISMLIGRQNSE
jgi:hypothetical protein